MPAVAITVGGVSRERLPQIPEEEIPEFVRYLQTLSFPDTRSPTRHGSHSPPGGPPHHYYNVGQVSDVAVTAARVPAKFLKPIQKAVDVEKVRGMVQNFDEIKDDVFIVSKDNQILDGHHRWLAIMEKNPRSTVRVIRVQLPIEALIQAAHDFEGSHIRKLGEIIRLAELIPQGLQ